MIDITHGIHFRTVAPATPGRSLKGAQSAARRVTIAVEQIFRRRASRHPDPVSAAGDELAELASAWRDVAGAWLFCALVAAVALAVVG